MELFSCCVSRAPTEVSSPPVGCGIVFQPDTSGALYVKSLSLDGPAFKSGLIEIGDCLVEVNHVNVHRKPISVVAPLMLGPSGTSVRLGFIRRGNNNSPSYTQIVHQVELMRGASSVPPGALTTKQYAEYLSTGLKTVPDQQQQQQQQSARGSGQMSPPTNGSNNNGISSNGRSSSGSMVPNEQQRKDSLKLGAEYYPRLD